MFLAFSDFRGGGFFLKWKGHFSFWGSAREVSGQCGGASNARGHREVGVLYYDKRGRVKM